ncbi:queuine tRNA-ribosyltransferase family protein [Microgenomates group bacterium]|nr:queuine tRNA-ribosyltransferase family protein [Microgenomates group bacterium]
MSARKNKAEKTEGREAIFCPDATRGVLRSLDSQDIAATKTKAMIVNTLHLRERPRIENLQKAGGIKKLMNWSGEIISDSGGFQIFSLFHSNPDKGKIGDEGLKIYTGANKQKVDLFSPEVSIQTQMAIGSDIQICLDDFTRIDADEKGVEESVRRTIGWARRSKEEFERLTGQSENKPQLFAVIQGHNNRKWRRYCADALQEIGFAGFGLGGWLFNEDGSIDYATMKFNAELTSEKYARYAMGFGKPEDVVVLFKMGYTIFDTVLPTRDARHGRLNVFNRDREGKVVLNMDKLPSEQEPFYRYVYLDKTTQHEDNLSTPDKHCGCHTCRNYSLAYLNHLFKIGDSLAWRLATIHNLYFYQELMGILNLA